MSSRARVGGTNPGAFKPKSSPINRGGANLARGQPIAAQVEPYSWGDIPTTPNATRDLPSWLPQPAPVHGDGGPGTFVPPPAFEPVTTPPVIDVDRIRISEGYAQFLGPTPAGDVINPGEFIFLFLYGQLV